LNILITGGAGFIGSNFVEYILSLGENHQLTILDSLTYAGMKENLEFCLNNKSVNFIEGDICNMSLVEKLFVDKGLVVNFAAESHVDNSINDSDSFVNTNIVGVHTLLKALKSMDNPPKFCQVSTDEVYGSLSPQAPAFTEKSRIQPSSPYSASKAAGDLLALSYFHTYKLPIILTRSSNNYGPRQMPEKFIPRMVFKVMRGEKLPIYGDGSHRRDWIYVKDNCQGIWQACASSASGEIYHFGFGEDIQNLDIANAIISKMEPQSGQIEFVADRLGHDFRYCLNTDLTQQKLDWRPEIKFAHGIDLTISWYQENKKWLKMAHARISKEMQ